MPRSPIRRLRYAAWPAQDRRLWESAFEDGDLFDKRAGTHLAPATRKGRKSDYSRFLGFLAMERSELLAIPPGARLDRDIVAKYVGCLRRNCRETTIAIMLERLRLVLMVICKENDWSWLRTITDRIRTRASPRPQKLMTSDRLYGLGIQLMERATAEVSTTGSVSEQHAKLHRDGLLIALLAAIPLRRRALTNLRIGKQLVRSGSLWALDIPAEDTKTRRSLEYSISPALSAYIDTYLLQFRRRIPGADSHDGLWPSMQGRPMCANTILQSITLRTRTAFGFSVSPHRFRHAAATFWQMHDPENVMGSKDLLGHASFRMTEKHYIMAQSRIAGRELARVIGRLKGDRAAAVESVFQHLSDNGAPIDGDHPVLS